KSAKVVLGDDIELEVVVKNRGKEAVDVVDLIFDKKSVSFEITLGEKKFRDVQSHAEPGEKGAEKKKLEPGTEMRATFKVPTIVVGDFKVSAVYAGAGTEIVSEAKKLK